MSTVKTQNKISVLLLAIGPVLVCLLIPSMLDAQGRGGRGGVGGRGTTPPAAKASAPIDLTGYWTSVITEDWSVRVLDLPANTHRGRIPYKPAGVQIAAKWDPAKDEAEGNQCKSYGAPGIMRQPTHLHITWQDDNTLKLEADFGTQTRLFHFAPPGFAGRLDYISGFYAPPETPTLPPPPGLEPSWQGYSVAHWSIEDGNQFSEKSGELMVVTDHLKPGYYWRNGMPYSGNAMLTEHFRVMELPDATAWIILVQIVEDPEYLNQPFVVNYQFKKLSDGSQWHPTPCAVK